MLLDVSQHKPCCSIFVRERQARRCTGDRRARANPLVAGPLARRSRRGCPAHGNYCYLAGSLKGAPITRVYANLPEIFAALPAYLGQELRGFFEAEIAARLPLARILYWT